MQLHLFGATTPTGEAFRQYVANSDIPFLLYSYSRVSATTSVDLINPSAFHPAGIQGSLSCWISFSPIWLFAPFIDNLSREYP